MSNIRMNNEYRNKFYNRLQAVLEQEETPEHQAFLILREDFDTIQTSTFEFDKQVVESS